MFESTRVGSDLSSAEQKQFDELLPEWQRRFPNKPEHQLRYALESFVRESTAFADRQARFNQEREWQRGQKARDAAAAAEEAQSKADLLKAQADRQAAEAAATKKLQDEARNTPRRVVNYAADDALQAAEKARNSAPDREVMCPSCKGRVRLVNGVLPAEHTAVTTDAQQMRVIRVCRPHDEPWRA